MINTIHSEIDERVTEIRYSNKRFIEEKIGEWIDLPFEAYIQPVEWDEDGNLKTKIYIGGKCSNCGLETGTFKPYFCWSCGCKMKNGSKRKR